MRPLAAGLAGIAALALAAPALGRPASAAKDGRPNILVVMTDDQAVTDVALMPNVKRLLARKGTTFADAVDNFPLCCPARATFITGQYAHNHDVAGNFYPYGWYGMKNRGNTLPLWLKRAGYRTAHIGKWLNGYGAKDGHGEIPKGWDTWRTMLDVSAYDYFNFVMNRNGKLKTWGDKDFARKLVKFADIEVTPRENPGLADVLERLKEVFGEPPYEYWGSEKRENYTVDVTGAMTRDLVARERKSRKPFFIWWSPAAPHREDVATSLMGRPGQDPRPPHRYRKRSKQYELPTPPSFNEADISDKPFMEERAPELTKEEIAQLQLDYEGRAGSLLAIDDHVKRLVETLRETGQLGNTLIMFVSDNGWLHGQHRVGGDKFLPYEESIRVPLILRGPGIPAGRTVRGQVANVDFAPTLLDAADAQAGRVQDGVSLLPVARDPGKRPDRAIQLEALTSLFQGDFGPFHRWARPYSGIRTDRYTYVVWTETGQKELYDREVDPHQLQNVAGDPDFAQIEAQLAAKLEELEECQGAECMVAP